MTTEAEQALWDNATDDERWRFGMQMLCFGGELDGVAWRPVGPIRDTHGEYFVQRFVTPEDGGALWRVWMVAVHSTADPHRLTVNLQGTVALFRALGWIGGSA